MRNVVVIAPGVAAPPVDTCEVTELLPKPACSVRAVLVPFIWALVD